MHYAKQTPRHCYASNATGYCKGEGFDVAKLVVDGSQAWPR